MSYSFTQKTPPTESGAESSQEDNLGGLVNDANHIAINVAAGIQTSDATGTPVTSPTAFPTTITTLTVPLNAINFVVIPLANTINVGEVSTSVTTYITCPTGIATKIPCARMASIFIKANTGAATGSTFYCEVI